MHTRTATSLLLAGALLLPPAAPVGAATDADQGGTGSTAQVCDADGLVLAIERGPREGTLAGVADDGVGTAIRASPVLTSFADALELSGLLGQLDDLDAATVLAPTDCAFAKVDPEVRAAALADPRGLLRQALARHVIPDRRLSEDELRGSFDTLSGEPVMVDGADVEGQADVVVGNIPTANAVLHLIDSVLLPPDLAVDQGGDRPGAAPDGGPGASTPPDSDPTPAPPPVPTTPAPSSPAPPTADPTSAPTPAPPPIDGGEQGGEPGAGTDVAAGGADDDPSPTGPIAAGLAVGPAAGAGTTSPHKAWQGAVVHGAGTIATGQRAVPIRLEVPAIGVDAPVTPLGTRQDGSLQVPDDPSSTGWWSGGAEPGERGAAVIVGHVDAVGGPAVLHDLHRVQAGQQIVVHRADGSWAAFVVKDLRQVPKAAFPSELVYGAAPSAQLRVITCGGALADGRYTDNLILSADLVAESTDRGPSAAHRP